MKVKFRQSGGYAGLLRGADLDTAELPAGERQRIEAMIEALPETKGARASRGADLTGYEIEIETPQGTRALSFDDLSVPEGMKKLLEMLQKKAGPVEP
jgi:hypothetical protein